MEAFATVAELALRLGRTFTVEQEPQIEALLEDASTYLRDVIGQTVYPRQTVTFEAEGPYIALPQAPVVSVDSVTRESVDVEYTYRNGVITIGDCDPVDVEFTFGALVAPEGLKRWTIVLVGQALTTLELNLGLTAGGLSSLALDDFKAAFADGGAQTGMILHPRNEEALRDQYGASTGVVGSQ